MFSKVLTVCLVLCAVQVLGGSIKPKLSAEVQALVQQIDMKSLVIENDIKMAATDKKHDMDMVKLNTKMALKQLKTAVKEGKNTLCGQVASLQARAIEQRANDVKLCNNKLDLKSLEKDLHGYLKNLHEEAMLIDRYCAFINLDSADDTSCVTECVVDLQGKMRDVETVIAMGLGNHQNAASECFKSIVDDVQMESGRIQVEMTECLNPTTEAPETEAPAHDSSESNESESSDKSESKESDESSSSQEVSEAPAESETEGDNDGNDGTEGDDQEQTSESSGNGEEGSCGDDTTTGDVEESSDNSGISVGDNDETPAETEKPTEEETPAVDIPAEDTPAEDTPAEDTPAEDTPVEDKPAEDTPAEDTPVEDKPAEESPAEDKPAEETPAEEVPAILIKESEQVADSAQRDDLQQPIVIKDDDEINIEY